jgi:hypothetical protein
MKRRVFLLFILFAAFFIQAPALEAQSPYPFGEEFELQWYLSTLDFGLINSDVSSFYFGLNFVSVSFMERKTAIGIELDPIQYTFIRNTTENLISFGQITLFWNTLRLIDYRRRGIIGPFMRFDLFIHNTEKFDIHKRIYTAGVQCAFDFHFMRVVGIELGYRNFDNKSNIYFSFKICTVIPLIMGAS